MPNFNKVMLMGNLTKDPEMRYTANGAPVCNMGMAINRKYKVKEETKEDVCFATVVVWNKQAESCAEFLKKGSPLFVEGRLQSKTWEKDGVKHYGMDVVAERVQFLGRGTASESGPDEGSSTPATTPAEEDIPF